MRTPASVFRLLLELIPSPPGNPSPPLIRLARLMLAVLAGFLLIVLSLFLIPAPEDSAQAGPPFQDCGSGPPVISGSQVETGTLLEEAIATDPGPSCKHADLVLAKTSNNLRPNFGDAVTYTITVTNRGPDNATGVKLVDQLPAALTFRSAVPSQGSCSGKAIITCDLITLPPGAKATVSLLVTPTRAGPILNTAQVQSREIDKVPDNNKASSTISVIGADLEVTKTVNNRTPDAGDIITYTITLANHGPDDATGVHVTDTPPVGLIFGQPASTQGSYSKATGLWEVGNLSAGRVATLTIPADVLTCAGRATIPNTATVFADQPDPNPANNRASTRITPTSAIYCVNFPIVFKDYEPVVCTPYDFNDSPGGWEVDGEGKVRTGYTENNDEYFIQRSILGMHIVTAPVGYSNRYTVEVDVRWDDIGYEYGLIFGQSDFPVPTYAFGIGPDPSQPTKSRYRLYRILTYDRSNGRVTTDCITLPCWIPTSINATSHHHLKVECQGRAISLYIDGTPLPKHNDAPYPCAGQVGVFAQSSRGDPNASAFFDNFKVDCPSQSSQSQVLNYQNTISPSSSMSVDLGWIE